MITKTQFQFIQMMAHDQAGLHLDNTQAQLVQHRLEPLADQTHRSSVSSLISQVMEGDDQALRSHVLEALIPTDTRFFRDACCMEALQADILPRLIRIRSSARSLRIWSAAASSGQEIYSILMMLHDDFPETRDWDLQAWATDLNPRAVTRIEEGLYSRCEAKRGLSSEQISAHFMEHGENLQILAAHRDRVHSSVMNLVKEWHALPTFDLILNRNVLHTFDAPTRVSLLQRTHDQLARDGILVVGASEGPLIPTIGFERITTTGCEYFQTTPDLPRYREEP